MNKYHEPPAEALAPLFAKLAAARRAGALSLLGFRV